MKIWLSSKIRRSSEGNSNSSLRACMKSLPPTRRIFRGRPSACSHMFSKISKPASLTARQGTQMKQSGRLWNSFGISATTLLMSRPWHGRRASPDERWTAGSKRQPGAVCWKKSNSAASHEPPGCFRKPTCPSSRLFTAQDSGAKNICGSAFKTRLANHPKLFGRGSIPARCSEMTGIPVSLSVCLGLLIRSWRIWKKNGLRNFIIKSNLWCLPLEDPSHPTSKS